MLSTRFGMNKLETLNAAYHFNSLFLVRIRMINGTLLEIKLTMDGYVFDDKFDDIIGEVKKVMEEFPKKVTKVESIDVEDGITERYMLYNNLLDNAGKPTNFLRFIRYFYGSD